jgi:hypothetical protein
MRLRDKNALPDDVARELAAIDAALVGEPVEPAFHEIAELSLTLRDTRPLPDAAAAERLDERAADGFAPVKGAAGEPVGLASLVRLKGFSATRLRARLPRQRLLPVAGGACAVLVAVAVGISVGGNGGGTTFDEPASTTALESVQPADAGGSSGGSVSPDAEALDSAAPGAVGPDSAAAGATARPKATDEAAPATKSAPQTATTVPGATVPPATGLAQPTTTGPQSLAGARRSVERGAQLRLATSPQRLDDVSAGVLGVTDGVGGIVRSSAIDSRNSGGSASFQLEIPSSRLQVALARLSQLASVRSRNESSIDVTEQVTFARNRVVALKAERRALVRRLEAAPSLDETARIRERLRSIDARLRTARAQRAALRHRTSYSNVNVEIATERRKGEAAGGPWTPDDALGDAARILELALGVTVVALAALAPLLLAGLIAWPLVVVARRRRRERALDASAHPAA